MSAYADELLDFSGPDRDFLEEVEPDYDAQYASASNPLRLLADDLVEAGWVSDPTGELWTHDDYGTVTFHEATRFEANNTYPTPESF